MEEIADDTLGRQELKAKLTREKILTAVISLIKEGGYAYASSAQIAKRAGVTWGAVQHHFGDKEQIMFAILQLSSDRLTELLSSHEMREGPLSNRVDEFVECLWEHYKSDIGWAALEILLALRAQSKAREEAFEVAMRIGLNCLENMKEIFSECNLNDEKLLDALRFTHSLLSGLSLQLALNSPIDNADGYSRYLKRMKFVLYSMLNGF